MVINAINYRDRPFTALFGLSLSFFAVSIPKIMIIGIVIFLIKDPSPVKKRRIVRRNIMILSQDNSGEL